MNIKEITDEIRSNLQPVYPGYMDIPKEAIRRQILFGLQTVGREHDMFKKYASFTTNSTSQEYEWSARLNTDYYLFKRPLTVRYASDRIEEINFKHYPDLGDTTLDAESKTRYYVNDVDKKLGLYNYASGKLVEVEYAGIPSISSVSDGAEPLPRELDDDLIGWATYKLMLRSPNPDKVLLGEYKQIASAFLRNAMKASAHGASTGQIKQHEWG